MFTAHFLAILVGIAKNLPKNLWDMLITQKETTLNFLQHPTLKPANSAWEPFNGTTRYNHAPLGPLSFTFIMHKKTNVHPS